MSDSTWSTRGRPSQIKMKRFFIIGLFLLIASSAHAGLTTAVRSFTWLGADVATTTYDVDFDCVPKFGILIYTGISTSTIDAIETATIATARGASVGFFTSSASRRAVAYTSDDAAAAAALAVSVRSDSVFTRSGSTGRLDVDAEANWPATDTVRFIVDNQGTGDKRISAFVVCGTDITAQAVGTITEPGVTGDQDTALGLTPTGVLLASVGFPTINSSSGSQGMFMLSCVDGTRSWVTYMGGDDGALTMDNVSYAKTAQAVALGPEPAVTLDAEATGSFSGTNLRLNWATQTAAVRLLIYLAWAGGQFRCDSTTTATDTNAFSQTGFGFQPVGGFYASAGRAASTASTPTAHAQISLGAADGTAQVAHASEDEDATLAAEIASAIEYDNVYINIDVTGQTILALCALTTFDVGGQTFTCSDAETTGSLLGTANWGATAAAATRRRSAPIIF